MRMASALGLLFGIAALLGCHRAIPASMPVNNPTSEASPAQVSDPSGEPAANSEPRKLQFSGYDWTVKSSTQKVGPGPNYFSNSSNNVAVDALGRLHLKITQRDGHWYCSEIVSARSFGYGTYRFYLDSVVDNLDPQVVLGMFTWNDAPDYHHREIDIEVSRWGRAENENGQFVVQPYRVPQNIVRFQIPSGLPASKHLFTWKPDSVFCQSVNGSASPQSSIIKEYTFTQGVPRAGGENVRINIWLLAGRPPADSKEAEVMISKFEFVPWQQGR